MAIARMLSDSGASVLMGSYGYVLLRLNENFNATCVVADGRSAAVISALKLGIPCVIISNQTSIEPFFRDSNFVLKLIGKPVDMTLKTLTVLAENTLIPDFPPPNTVCINTLSNNRHIMKKQIFVGPVVSDNFRNPGKSVEIDGPFVLTLLGGHSYRLPIFNGILKIAHRFPDKGQIEQESNATRMRELGVCQTLDYSSMSPASLFEKIDILLKDGKYRDKAAQFSEMAKRMNGTKKAADIIIELSERIQCFEVEHDP